MFIHNMLIYYQYCFEEKKKKKEEKKRRRLQKKEERKRHFRKWNEWRKQNLNSKFHQLLVLFKVYKSPSFESYATKQEMQETLDEMNRIIENRSDTPESYVTKQAIQEALDEMNRIIDNRGDPPSTPKNI